MRKKLIVLTSVPKTSQKLTLPTPQPLQLTSEETLTPENYSPEDKNPDKDEILEKKNDK